MDFMLAFIISSIEMRKVRSSLFFPASFVWGRFNLNIDPKDLTEIYASVMLEISNMLIILILQKIIIHIGFARNNLNSISNYRIVRLKPKTSDNQCLTDKHVVMVGNKNFNLYAFLLFCFSYMHV
ncbi:CLUMA_CG008851, isoform A [Clunio marinus]|uniref:CLUMA_CG008851, isoform A n=1 Tax=Clunio marinus TaxID=568069 RepID=A0A1J1I9Z5_9DIPT|nr:CLUMA_CG008851, isoform A [Clunio marinus]